MQDSKLKQAALLMSIPLLTASLITTPPTVKAATPTTISKAATTNEPTTPVLPAGIEQGATVEGITEYRLPNGLKVLLFPDQSKPTITVNITYLVGSRLENYGETGMAHLLEHMVFKGTPKHPNIPQELTSHGTRPNGTTSYDRTNYFETFQASEENLAWALDLESDRMINSFIARKDLDSEMTVVRNEFERGENSPQSILFERALSTAYLWHNYGKSTIGARSDIEKVSIEHLQAFYRTYYQPDNAVLTVAGKIDAAKTLDMINKYFASIPKPTRILPKTYTDEPIQDGERSVTLRRVGDVQIVGALYHVPSGAHPDFAAIDILTGILGDPETGRLQKALVETKKATVAFGDTLQLREPGIMLFGTQVRPDLSIDEAKQILLKTVQDIVDNPPTAEEVERVRTSQLKDFDLALNDASRVGLQLSNWLAMGDWRLFFLYRDRIKKVTVDDVKKVAAKYLRVSNRTIATFIPDNTIDRAEIPDTPDVAEMLKDYKSTNIVATGEAFDATPENIDSRTIRNSAQNLKLALLPKKTRGSSVNMSLTVHLGDEKSLFNRGTAGALAANMLIRGTSKHTRKQLQDEFDKLKARVNIGGTPTQANVRVETVRENLPAVMRLVAEVLREPGFSADEFEQLKQQNLSGIEQRRSEPDAIASTELQKINNGRYPKGDFRYPASPDEDIADLKAVTLDDVKKFYQDFYGASLAEMTVIGDFDDKEVTKIANELFGSWRNSITPKYIPSDYQNLQGVNKSFETPDKANAFFIANLLLNIRDDDPQYPALVLGNYMVGGGFLNSRLASRIRQKEGLSYGVGSQLNASALDKVGSFTAFAIYAPQNVTRLEAAFKEEMERMLKDGFKDEEVAAAKSGLLQSFQVSRAQDNELVARLNRNLFINRTMAYDADFDKKIQALTAQQILDAMRKYIDINKITIIKAGDFAKGAKATTK